MSERDEKLAQDETAERLPAGGEAITGHLDGIDAEGRVLFRPDGEQAGVPAMIGLELDDARLVRAAWLGSRALALRTGDTGEQGGRLVLVALVRERVAAAARDALPGELQVKLDGDTLRLSARRRLELVCGKTRLVLDEDGRLELNGTYLLQRSRGPIKLKGATIELN
jgi:hypothetical protein